MYELQELYDELLAWLPSETEEFRELFFRLLTSLPGGEYLEDIGYEPFPIGWKEAELIAKTLQNMQSTGDVAKLIHVLTEEGIV